MSVGGGATVGGGGRAALSEADLDKDCTTLCSYATGWASYSRAVSTLRLGGAIDANDAMRAAGQGPELQRARDGGKEVLEAEGVATG